MILISILKIKTIFLIIYLLLKKNIHTYFKVIKINKEYTYRYIIIGNFYFVKNIIYLTREEFLSIKFLPILFSLPLSDLHYIKIKLSLEKPYKVKNLPTNKTVTFIQGRRFFAK
jgi:hypothetical protein